MTHRKLSDFISGIQKEIKLLESKGADCPERAHKIQTYKSYLANLEQYRGKSFNP